MTMPDDDNHIMGIYVHMGVALMGNHENTVFLDRGGFDMYVPEGTHSGYVRITFADESTFDFKYQGREFRKKGSDLPSIDGTGEFIKGTGRFANIKGTLTYEGGYITPYDKEKGQVGDSVVDYQATYTLGR
jgi:hypothetical protein